MPQVETRYEEEAQRGLRIRYYPAPHELQRLRERLWHYFYELVGFSGMLVLRQVGCPKKVDAFVCKTRRRPYSSKTLDPSCFHTDLFQQLTARTGRRILARIQAAGGDLDQRSVRRVPILLDEQHRRIVAVRIGRERHDGRRTRMANHLQLSG